MQFTDFGEFAAYTPPSPLPGVFYWQSGDGRDWYELTSGWEEPGVWALVRPDNYVALAATDPTTFIPASGMRVAFFPGVSPTDIRGIHLEGPTGSDPAPTPLPKLTRRQFALEAHTRAMLPDADAIALVATGHPSAAMERIINSLPVAQRFPARLSLAADSYAADNEVIALFLGDSVRDFFLSAASR